MLFFAAISWTVVCLCWAWKGLGWPFWQVKTSTAWQSLGPMARIDDSSLPLIAVIVLWVAGLAIIVSLKGRT